MCQIITNLNLKTALNACLMIPIGQYGTLLKIQEKITSVFKGNLFSDQ